MTLTQPALRVLVTDNDPDYLASTLKLMQAQKWLADGAPDLAQATMRLQPPWSDQYDVVVTDLRMRGHGARDRSGLQVARMAQDCGLPAIIVTQFGSEDEATRVLETHGSEPAPALRYVAKRDGPAALLRAIHSLRGVSLLHVSDLHLVHSMFGSQPLDQETAALSLVEDLLCRPHLALNPVQAIVVSGDLSYRCRAESFAEARSFLVRLATALDIPMERVILAPGNHDVQRELADGPADPRQQKRADPGTWLAKFQRYLSFSEYFYGEEEFSAGRPYRVFEVGNDLAVVAFNSCVCEGHVAALCQTCYDPEARAGSKHFYGWLDPEDVTQAGADLSGRLARRRRLAIFHHNVLPGIGDPCHGKHLLNYDDPHTPVGQLLYREGFRLVLHGHRHQPLPALPGAVGAEWPYAFGCGAFWTEGSQLEETAGYLVLTLGGYQAGSRLHMRRFCPKNQYRRGHWSADSLIARDGMLPLSETLWR